MISDLSTEILMGQDLSQEDLNLINRYRKVRLNRTSTWDHQNNNHFHDRLFFLIRDNNNLTSFGTLRPIKVYIENQEVNIMGIQAIISIVQRKGYGKILMQEMIRYANNNKLTLVGFCEHKNAEFYIKCGLRIFDNRNLNFIFVKESGDEYTEEGDVIYYSTVRTPIEDALLKDKIIKHFIPHW